MILVADTSGLIAASDTNAPESAGCQYAGRDLDLADGVNVALAAEYRTCSVLTLDRRDSRGVGERHRPDGGLRLTSA